MFQLADSLPSKTVPSRARNSAKSKGKRRAKQKKQKVAKAGAAQPSQAAQASYVAPKNATKVRPCLYYDLIIAKLIIPIDLWKTKPNLLVLRRSQGQRERRNWRRRR